MLQRLIGRERMIENRQLRIVEILMDEGFAIIEQRHDQTSHQENQFGDIHRRAARQFTVPLVSELDAQKLHPVIEQFLTQDEIEPIRAFCCPP
ncbi:MAG TPA: hypothetical protein ENJ84_00615 [Gammaproteobacteria bacterium]|nr:hypothetical protein [Gammaproteobacteria bacterium]